MSHTATATPMATISRTNVSVRLPNSMNGWIPNAPWNWGVKVPASHWGHVEHPSPEPVSRTAPPVTMMPPWVKMFATVKARAWRPRKARERWSGLPECCAGASVVTRTVYEGRLIKRTRRRVSCS